MPVLDGPAACDLDGKSQSSDCEEERCCIVGKFGAGKSTVCNIITGTENFAVSSGLDGVTKQIKHEEVEFSDNSVRYTFKVVDTVGLFNPESDRESDAKATNVFYKHNNIFSLHRSGGCERCSVCIKGRLQYK